ncbi:hypothetical protein BC830DRAFT_1079974 [Chytriomyces sp. MP71]|nr:hypothetical protein BC830DRAFT_1079974 [Chytriomyces sp. MP71]
MRVFVILAVAAVVRAQSTADATFTAEVAAAPNGQTASPSSYPSGSSGAAPSSSAKTSTSAGVASPTAMTSGAATSTLSPHSSSTDYSGDCTGVADNLIVCASSTTFWICANGGKSKFFCTTLSASHKIVKLVLPKHNLALEALSALVTELLRVWTQTVNQLLELALPVEAQAPLLGQATREVAMERQTTPSLVLHMSLGSALPEYSPTVQHNAVLQACYITPPATTPIYTPPATCSTCPDEYWVATSDGNGYYTCHGGQPKQSSPRACDVPGMVPCPNLNRCDWPGCKAYNPPSNACDNEADNAVVCTSTLTYNICKSGLIAASADQMCTGGTVCCQNLGRCDWPGCGGGSMYIPVPGTPAPTSYTPSCAGKADGDITCIDATTIQYCQNGQLIPNTATQSCAPGTVCCENMPNSCGWPGCAYPCPNSTITPIGGGGYGGSQPFLYTHGPKPDFCDEQANDWSHQGKFCVGTRSNMWCDNGEISRLNFCPSDQICCEQTGECGHPSEPSTKKGQDHVGCFVPKNIPRRTEGCRSDRLNDCDDLSDGARVCTGMNTFSYCLDQQVFAFAEPMTCPEGYLCCPNLGGRCEEDCNYPTQPVGQCNDQPDGATVCSGYKSYKVCHNGGCLGTFDCVGDDMVCCPLTGACSKKAACDSHAFWPTTDDACYGFLNKRVCTPDGLVNICLDGHVVAKFPADAGYDFGCDNDGKHHPAKGGYGYGQNAAPPAPGYGQPAPAAGYGHAAPAQAYGQPASAQGYGYGQAAPAQGYDKPAPAQGYGQAAPTQGYGTYWLPTSSNGYSSEEKYN